MATVLLYLAFLLAEQRTFSKKMAGLFTDSTRHQSFIDSLKKIDSAVKSYLSIKTLAGLIAGIGSLIVFKLVGLEFALIFAMVMTLAIGGMMEIESNLELIRRTTLAVEEQNG